MTTAGPAIGICHAKQKEGRKQKVQRHCLSVAGVHGLHADTMMAFVKYKLECSSNLHVKPMLLRSAHASETSTISLCSDVCRSQSYLAPATVLSCGDGCAACVQPYLPAKIRGC